MTNASYVRDQLLDSMPNDALALVIDITGCRYLDSAAIEVLFDLSRRLARRRQDLRLVMPPSSPLKRVIELTDVHTAAPVHESLDVGALRSSLLRNAPHREGRRVGWRTNRRRGSATWRWSATEAAGRRP